MPSYPDQVQQLHDALERLDGVIEVNLDIRGLADIDESMLSLPGEFANLPHALLRRTKGGLANEILVTAQVRFSQDRAGWTALEFLAWWVRDLSRSHINVQMRPLALPPVAYGTQLGRTLTFVIEFFFINPGENNDPIFEAIAEHADSLNGNMEDYAEALAHPTQFAQDDLATLQRCADLDDAAAQYRLALRYDRGEGVAEDKTRAFAWFQRSAENHYPYALLAVARCCRHGVGVPRCNPEMAFDYYGQAAESGLPEAQCELAQCHARGEGTEKDPAQAAKWFAEAAEQEYPEAMRCLGRCYAQGSGVEQDFDKAFHLYQQAAEADDATAMGLLGECFAEGRGTAKDLSRMIDWYRRGAEAGDIGCQAELGDCYYGGRGVDRDLRQALYWFQQALDQGFDPVAGVVDEIKAKLNEEV